MKFAQHTVSCCLVTLCDWITLDNLWSTANPSRPINYVDYDPTLTVESTQESTLRLDISTDPVCTDYTPPRG